MIGSIHLFAGHIAFRAVLPLADERFQFTKPQDR